MTTYLASAEADNEVSDERVFSLAGPVRHHGAPAIALGQLVSLDGLGDGADLVDLEQQAVAGLLLDGGGDPLGVGHGQVVANDLDGGVGSDLAPRLPVVLVKGILNRGDGELLDELLVKRFQLVTV